MQASQASSEARQVTDSNCNCNCNSSATSTMARHKGKKKTSKAEVGGSDLCNQACTQL
jgi:hypothetical protein